MSAPGQPFRRILAVMAEMAAIRNEHGHSTLGASMMQNAYAAYTSRGHGGKRAHRPTGISACKRAARKARNVRRHRAACRA